MNLQSTAAAADPARTTRAGRRSIVPGAVSATDESDRVADARSRAQDRLRRQRETLRPLGVVIMIAVVAGSLGAHPAPAFHGRGLAITFALVVFCGTLAFAIRPRFAGLTSPSQAGVIAAMAAAGIALEALQPKAATGVAGAAAVWMAVVRIPGAAGWALGGAATVGLAIASALAGSSAAGVLATTLLCALLGLVAYFIRQARDGEERTEVLMAQLEDARDEQARAAAVAERARIASELHDVLAHSLSGAAIQLQGARKLGERHSVEPQVQAAIDRASELVRDGLTQARSAVGALRGDALPTVSELQALIESFRDDMHVDVTLAVDGDCRALPADASLALYRGAQEALTNVARYAPGATACVSLQYGEERTQLTIDNSAPTGAGGLPGVGGGRGLEGLRERIERAGGSLEAGPLDGGWRVRLEVPV
jgi:signal transduction histidine kinase